MSRICVRKWYGPIAEEMIENQAKRGYIRLLVDASKVSFHHQLLMVALAYRRRSIPIVWTWIKCKRGHSSAIKQLALLKYVHKLIPKSVDVSIVGDCEFGAVDVLRCLDTCNGSTFCDRKVIRLSIRLCTTSGSGLTA